MKRYRGPFLLAASAVVILGTGLLFFGGREKPAQTSGGPAAIPGSPAGTAAASDIRPARPALPPGPPASPSSYARKLENFRQEGETRGCRVIREDASGLTLEIKVPQYQVDKLDPEGQEHRVTIPGYISVEEPGRPTVPALIVSVPLPGVESVTVAATASTPRTETGILLPSAPDRETVRRELRRISGEESAADPGPAAAISSRWQEFSRAIRRIDGEGTAADVGRDGEPPDTDGEDRYPDRVVESSGPLWADEEQFVNLLVTPLQYSRSARVLSSRDTITVEIAFGAPAVTLPRKTQTDYGAQFELSASPDSFRASVTEDGIQLVTYQDLSDAGFNLGGDPRELRVYSRGQEIAIHVEGEEDGTWDPGDYLAFYGERDTGFYTQTKTYWLYQTSGTGRRMGDTAADRSGRPSRQENFPHHLHLEERVSYQPYLDVGAGNDCWFWDFAGYTYGTNYNSIIQFTLDGVSAREGQASLSARYFGYTSYPDYNPDHHTRVYLNGQLVGDFTWNGEVFYNFQTDIPQQLILEGVNTITTAGVNDLGLPVTGEFIFIDYFDLVYYRDYRSVDDCLIFAASGKGDYRVSGFSGSDVDLYRITDPAAPRRLAGVTVQTGGDYTLDFRKHEAGEELYWAGRRDAAFNPPLVRNAPADLVSPRAVDYVIVTHPDFQAAVQPLADFRQAGGQEVEFFDINDIYNTFGFGDFTPQAIQRFLQYAYTEWSALTRPRYALLVGDGNYDYRNYRGSSPPNYVPPYMVVDPYMETAADNWYACLIGEDRVPDIDLGRLSASTAAQAADLVGKIVGYELSTDGLSWQREILMVADNPDPGAGDFPADSDWLIANYFPPEFTAQTAYLPVLGVSGTTNAIINGINNGKLLINYIGHGSATTWSNPSIFRVANIASLTNGNRLNLLVTPTCLNGYWCDVSGSCLAEAMTRAVGKGSVAAISPSGLSLNSPARQLAGFLFEELLTEKQPTGTALTRAKARLAGLTPWLYMLDIYTLFGDPALELK